MAKVVHRIGCGSCYSNLKRHLLIIYYWMFGVRILQSCVFLICCLCHFKTHSNFTTKLNSRSKNWRGRPKFYWLPRKPGLPLQLTPFSTIEPKISHHPQYPNYVQQKCHWYGCGQWQYGPNIEAEKQCFCQRGCWLVLASSSQRILLF